MHLLFRWLRQHHRRYIRCRPPIHPVAAFQESAGIPAKRLNQIKYKYLSLPDLGPVCEVDHAGIPTNDEVPTLNARIG